MKREEEEQLSGNANIQGMSTESGRGGQRERMNMNKREGITKAKEEVSKKEVSNVTERSHK